MRGYIVIHLQASEHTKRQPGQGVVYVFADNVDAVFEELRSKGANVLHPPKDFSYGMRDFIIADPDGNQLSFGMQSKASS